MEEDRSWFVGVDWATVTHYVRISDARGRKVGEKTFEHSGEGLAAMAAWIVKQTVAEPDAVDIAIEVPHGPVVESLMEYGFRVHAINPKQLDRFRDRFSPAGAKDDSRDAEVLADALRTDPRCFRRIEPLDPTVVELREWSRTMEEYRIDRIRLGNRVRNLLWRYYPQIVDLTDEIAAPWFLSLWRLAPTPEKAMRLRADVVDRLLKRHHIRRIKAAEVLRTLRAPSITVAAGTAMSVSAHLDGVITQLELLNRQIAEAESHIDLLIEQIATGQVTDAVPEADSALQRDVTVLRSLPGVGRTVLATLLAEAGDALRQRDYHALRCLCGVAPVTKRSGKSHIVLMRQAVHVRLRNALYYWARIAVQYDQRSRVKYAALRARGLGYARVLRSVADRLLAVACAMLRSGTIFDPTRASHCEVD